MPINIRKFTALLLLVVGLVGCQSKVPAVKTAQPKPAVETNVLPASQAAAEEPGAQQAEPKLATAESLQAELYVLPVPETARVRVMNIKPKFVQGMKLPAGRYSIEVTAPGYRKVLQWISLEAGKMRRLKVELAEQ